MTNRPSQSRCSALMDAARHTTSSSEISAPEMPQHVRCDASATSALQATDISGLNAPFSPAASPNNTHS
jgi:hypothetical protein